MIARPRLIGAILIVLTLVAGAGYTGWRITVAHSATAAPLDLNRTGTLLSVDPHDGRVHQALDGQVVGVGPACHRAYAAAGTLACLRPTAFPGGHELAVYDRTLTERIVIPVWGTPSRARVSPSGRLVAWTVFRSGDSYMAPGGFSTTAGIYDLATGAHHGSLEDFTSIVDGHTNDAADRNFWGITFAPDDRTVYATMSSANLTRLMRGDLRTRTLEASRTNVECPSLSPDATRIAYKHRTAQTWRLHVLDLTTGADTPLAEPAHVDDQPTWLNSTMIAYTRPVDDLPTLFTIPADGSGHPHRLRPGSSPTPVS